MHQVSPAAIARHYATLHTIGLYKETSEQGFDRPAYSEAETLVMRYFESEAKAAGLLVRWDQAGNLIIETSCEFSNWLETGSHVDTVPGGGNFDGLAGVVAGFEAIKLLQDKQLSVGLRLRIWRGEESSSFGLASLGSLAAVGKLPQAVLDRSYRGKTLKESMQAQGAESEWIESGKPTITVEELDKIVAHIELHIEQGSVLEKEGADIGVVTGIRGSARQWVRVHGQFDHSGATPMGTEFRKDANLAMAYMQVKLDQLLSDYAAEAASETELVQTFGAINNHEEQNQRFPQIGENAISKVSGFAYFSHEVRSCCPDSAAAFMNKSQQVMGQVAEDFGVAVEFESISQSSGILALDESIQAQVVMECEAQDKSYAKLPSGAWHDVAVLSQQSRSYGSKIPTGLIFIPCKSGLSHSALEYASDEQIAIGASVLAGTFARIAASYA